MVSIKNVDEDVWRAIRMESVRRDVLMSDLIVDMWLAYLEKQSAARVTAGRGDEGTHG